MKERLKIQDSPDIDKAYLAGLIDAHGSICISRSLRNETGQFHHSFYIRIYGSDKETLDWVKEYCGGKIYKEHKAKLIIRTGYYWVAHNRSIKVVLESILQFLHGKKKDIKNAIAFLNTLNLADKKGCSGFPRLKEGVLEERGNLYLSQKEIMVKRGKSKKTGGINEKT